MANTTTKSILLSQSKTGAVDVVSAPTLTHSLFRKATSTEVKVEVPGVDPASIQVGFENNHIHIDCEKGVLNIPVDPTVDTSKIKADVVWGLLTLSIPLPEVPVSRTIKVSVHESAPAPTPAKRTVAKILEEV